jgi:hypothetical protein
MLRVVDVPNLAGSVPARAGEPGCWGESASEQAVAHGRASPSAHLAGRPTRGT